MSAAQLAEQTRIADQLFDGVEPRVDRRDLGERVGDPVGQQPRAHRRDRGIDGRQQRTFAAAFPHRAGDFQAAPRGFVDFQAPEPYGASRSKWSSDDFWVSRR